MKASYVEVELRRAMGSNRVVLSPGPGYSAMEILFLWASVSLSKAKHSFFHVSCTVIIWTVAGESKGSSLAVNILGRNEARTGCSSQRQNCPETDCIMQLSNEN